MKPHGNLKVVLVYEYLGKEIPVAETRSNSLLNEVKRCLLEDSEIRVNLARAIDPVVYLQEQAEFWMKKRVLDLLLKEHRDVSGAKDSPRPCKPSRNSL